MIHESRHLWHVVLGIIYKSVVFWWRRSYTSSKTSFWKAAITIAYHIPRSNIHVICMHIAVSLMTAPRTSPSAHFTKHSVTGHITPFRGSWGCPPKEAPLAYVRRLHCRALHCLQCSMHMHRPQRHPKHKMNAGFKHNFSNSLLLFRSCIFVIALVDKSIIQWDHNRVWQTVPNLKEKYRYLESLEDIAIVNHSAIFL